MALKWSRANQISRLALQQRVDAHLTRSGGKVRPGNCKACGGMGLTAKNRQCWVCGGGGSKKPLDRGPAVTIPGERTRRG